MQIIAKDLSYSYDKGAKFERTALKNVSLTIETGDFFGIVGRTGSGKSTFVQHLNALIPVQSGELFIGDFYLCAEKQKGKKGEKKGKNKRTAKADLKKLRRSVGMVFQYPEYQLFAETVFDDVAFGLKNFYKDLTKTEIESKVETALKKVGLNYEEVKSKSPFELSGGQKRRVAIAGVLVFEPEIIVLDEPVAGLDPMGKAELWSLLHSINTPERTVIIVSHDMDDVLENCNKVAVFSEGELITVGAPRQVFADGSVIEKSGLDYPVTKYLCDGLKDYLGELDYCPKPDEFVEEIVRKISK